MDRLQFPAHALAEDFQALVHVRHRLDSGLTVPVADADNWHLELNVSGGVSPDVTLTMRDGMERSYEFALNTVKMLRTVESFA